VTSPLSPQSGPQSNPDTKPLQAFPAVAFLSQDLMFYSQISSAAKSSGLTSVMSKNAADLATKATSNELRWVIVDLFGLKTPVDDVCSQVRSAFPNATLIGFGPHVDREELAEARNSQFDYVMTRGEFHRSLPTLFRS
jgi:hypothetical protein